MYLRPGRSRPEPASTGPSLMETKEEHKARLDSIRERWDAEEFIDLEAIDETWIQARLRGGIGETSRDLSQEQREALIVVLARHVKARSSREPSAYIDIAQADTAARWVTAKDEREWSTLRRWHEFEYGNPPASEEGPDAILSKYISTQLKKGFRWTGFCVTPKGMRVDAVRVRAVDQVFNHLAQVMTNEEHSYWFENGGTSGLTARKPEPSFEAILVRDSACMAVNICMLVRTEDGRAFNWHSMWYWDGHAHAWLCHMMARKGWHAYMYF
ncbi:MAG: hypothetical protein IT434_16235 [Phycisphaerales bacterium]|nr:hypothetical protein [Phycisphaerales bacterium]